jgi:nitroreductase
VRMEFSELLDRRRMVRAYRPEPVDARAVHRILESARRGPSAGFTQGVSFAVLTDRPQRRRMAELCGEPSYVAASFHPWLSVAPVHVVPCVSRAAYESRYAEADKSRSVKPGEWTAPFWWVDGGAALMLLLLAAVDEGLAAGFLALPDSIELRELLALRDDELPVGLVTIGHAAEDTREGSRTRGRKPFDEQVHFR